jgi:hypothetical protein
MSKHIEILISAPIPDDNEESGHDAMVQSREPAHAIVELLHKLGLKGATQTRRIYTRKVKHPATAAATPTPTTGPAPTTA